jgi:formylmethanofuran dehydrogenase subunit E-like metal-binding protein
VKSINKQGINRNILIIIFSVFFAVSISGAASAADLSTTVISNHTIGVKVNYEYASDSTINPEIKIKSATGAKINSKKIYKQAYKCYEVSFTYLGSLSGSKYNVIVSAPGYKTQTKLIKTTSDPLDSTDKNLYGSATFNMNATANYRLGRIVTTKADHLLNFNSADKVLAITTAGVPKLNGGTSEDCIEGILNYANGKISYGKGNLLMLRQTKADPVDFIFVTKKGSYLKAVSFKKGSSVPAYVGTISQSMTRAEWNNFIKHVGGENAFSFASLANAWAAGAPADVLREAAFHGHVCEGTIGGYTITKTLLQYYPPIKATAGGSGSPGDITSYKVLGLPGGSDDDAAMYFLDATPGKGGYTGFDTTSTGATDNMVAFIRWVDTTYKLVNNTDGTQSYVVKTPGTGSLIVMQYNKEQNRKTFKKQTKITTNGDLEELKYNTWLIQKIKSNPGELVTIIKELDGLTEKQYYYLLGSAGNITFPSSGNATNKGQTRIVMQEAHGLDLKYINSLNLTKATRSTVTTKNNQLTYDQMKKIGVNAATLAKQIFKNELGINLDKEDRDLAVLTSAGYVYLNGQTTEATWDGISDVLGSRLTRSTLLPIHMGVWKPLWFNFVLRGADGTTMSSVYIRYNPLNNTFFVGTNADGKQVNDIGPAALNNATKVSNLGAYVIPDGNFFNIQSIANAWRNDPTFDQLMTFLFHDHACPGVQPGFFISDYIFKNYPLTGDQSYFWMASSIYCKDDSLVYLLNVSPGMGTYMNQRLTNEETMSEYLPTGTEEGIIVVWDPKTKTGKAAVISFKWPTYKLDGLLTPEAQREAMISAFVSLYKGESSPFISEPLSIAISNENYISEKEFNTIKKGGMASSNSLQYYKDLPMHSLADLIKVQNGSSPVDPGSDNGGSAVDSGSDNGISTSNVGNSGLKLNAAPSNAANNEAGTDPTTSEGKSYEVSKTNTNSSNSGVNVALIVIGILLIGGLLVVGFYKDSIFGFLK